METKQTETSGLAPTSGAERSAIYFISDLHLGAGTMTCPLDYERRVVRFLDSIRGDCAELWLLGDVIDYWFEYRHVVPKGFTRFLGKLGELSDSGVRVHWLTGNHDIWIFGYIQEETGAQVHTEGGLFELQGKRVYMAHGDGLGDDNRGYRLMTRFFHSRTAQWLYRWIHPDWATGFAHWWSKKSRLDGPKFPDYLGEDREHLVLWAKQYLRNVGGRIAEGKLPATAMPDLMLFGHRHIMLDLMLSRQTRMMILGDWLQHFSYAVMRGGEVSLEQFEVDESLYDVEERQGVSIAF